MSRVNSSFFSLDKEYIFPIIEEKIISLEQENNAEPLINLSIGDVALPLVPSVADAIKEATSEMQEKNIGYGPSLGYPFLREKIATTLFSGLDISPDEIFVSDGANSDLSAITDIFAPDCKIALPDPAYPAYHDMQVLAGREIVLLPCTEENNFLPVPPNESCDLVFLCTPHNPTGTAMTKEQLQAFVDYAHENNAILIIDAAYAPFALGTDIPFSIYEIPRAKEIAIEIHTFSKSAGFTGLRCGFSIIPKELTARHKGKKVPLHPLWKTRQSINSNGVAYPIQRGAEAALSFQGQQETRSQIATYKKSAELLRKALAHQPIFGGEYSPYIWWKCPPHRSSWEFFDEILHTCHILTIPGCGFGKTGEGFVRLSCFTTPELATIAAQRFKRIPHAHISHA